MGDALYLIGGGGMEGKLETGRRQYFHSLILYIHTYIYLYVIKCSEVEGRKIERREMESPTCLGISCLNHLASFFGL